MAIASAVHDALVRSSALPLPLLCDAALVCASALRSRTLHVLQRRAPPSHILPFDAPYCSLQPDDELSLSVRSLEYNSLDEQAKQALRNAWRVGASHAHHGASSPRGWKCEVCTYEHVDPAHRDFLTCSLCETERNLVIAPITAPPRDPSHLEL